MDTPTAQPLGKQEIPIDAAEICWRHFGVEPKREQLEVAEYIGRGKDVVLIAACGWGKSLVYYLPLVLWGRGVIVIISPLRAIMREQHQKLDGLGISSICLLGEGEVITEATIAKLEDGDYRAVFLTPEIMFQNYLVDGLWYNQKWRSQLRAIVLDEAHRVYTWGEGFRKHYSQLGALRPRLPPQVAFIALSATLPRDVLRLVKKSSGLDLDAPVINTGNDRPNVMLFVKRMGIPRYSTLEYLLTDRRKTIVYFEKIEDLYRGYKYLRVYAKEQELEANLSVYFTILSEEYKVGTMETFRKGELRILFTTEAAGMGCDISDIECVVQFGAPASILTLVQRLGRAARTPTMQGYGVVFCTPKQLLEKGQDLQLHEFLTTTTCRRQVLDAVFDNIHKKPEKCCDICNNDLYYTVTPEPRQYRPSNIRYIPRGIQLGPEQQAAVRQELERWRQKIYDSTFGPSTFYQIEPSALLQDVQIDVLVKKAPILISAVDVRQALVQWHPLSQGYFKEIAELIQAAIRRDWCRYLGVLE